MYTNITKSGRKTPSYYIEIQGQQFGHWIALERVPNKRGKAFYLCECSCGVKRVVAKTQLQRGLTTNCGHIHKPKQQIEMENFGKAWTEEEITLLKQWYPVNGSHYLTKHLKRSKAAIRAKAEKEDIKCLRPKAYLVKPDAWKAWEILAIKEHYPKGGAISCLPHLPDRSKHAIWNKAGHLGLKVNEPNKNRYRRIA